MINWLHSLTHNPRRGWDPIRPHGAAAYSSAAGVDQKLIQQFDTVVGGLRGKRVVDLGSGPGQYAVEFALRGAMVTCIDVSALYLAMTAARMRDRGVEATLVAGYMDHVNELTGGGLDAAFSHVSWCYAMNDLSFARQILRALVPGGVAFVRSNTSEFEQNRSLRRKLVYSLNNTVWWKIGHPHPPHGRVAAAFRRQRNCTVEVDYSEAAVDLVIARKLAT